MKSGYGRGYRVKRSRWAHFVAGAVSRSPRRKKTDHFGPARLAEALVQGRPNKTMPVYGAESRALNHADIRENKTAGRWAVILQKMRLWMRAPTFAP